MGALRAPARGGPPPAAAHAGAGADRHRTGLRMRPSAVRARGAGRPPARAPPPRPHRLRSPPRAHQPPYEPAAGKAPTIAPDKPTGLYPHGVTDRPHERPEVSHPADQTSRQHSDDRAWVPWSQIESPDEPAQSETAKTYSGWDAPGVVGNPDRPDPETIHLEPDRRSHILDGGPTGKGGGHRHGTEKPGKTEFPPDWDDDTTCAYIEHVARNPDSPPEQQRNRRWECQGTHDGVTVVVIVWPEGKIWAAWPEPGGRGVIANPEDTA
ncbi:MAG: hypothetical protein GEV11_07910 [Streptosporangiales bacterium]|nr:hypothetical protein [Streptosporangiales bacterium]